MSYDIWLELEGMRDDDPGNITYNVDPMFALAIDGDPETAVQNGADVVLHHKDPALKRFVGETASECLPALRRAVEAMEAAPADYEALNPPNGWGDYEGALEYLRRFVAACERSPSATVEGWL